MNDFNTLIDSHKAQFKQVLSRFRVIQTGDNLADIKKGIAKHGARFEIALINALNNGAAFNNYSTAEDEAATTPERGKFWSFVYKALDAAGSSAAVITQLKNAVSTPGTSYTEPTPEEITAQKQNLYLWLAAGAALVILLFLYFKNK